MFNLGRMRVSVFFVAAFVAFSAAPVSAQMEATGRVNAILMVQDENLLAGVERSSRCTIPRLAAGPPVGMKKPAAPVAHLKSWW